MSGADLLIRGATVIDGTGAPGTVADVAVSGGRIVEAAGSAVRVIDADGLVLAPGFIDVHTHDDAAALSAEGMHPKISQGVTTVVTGNCGISLAPSPLTRRDTPPPPLNLLGPAEIYGYEDFGAYLDALAEAGPVVNVFPLVGHMALRSRAMEDLDRPAGEAEIAAMRADLARALEAGAQGLSTGLAYPPSKHAATAEILALARDVADRRRLWTTHMRDERTGVVAAVAETIDIARRSGVRTLISHHKCCGASAFGLSRTTLSMIAAAREEMALDLDVYPYTASSTVLIENFARDSRKVTISWSDPHPETAGRDLADICSEWGLGLEEAIDRLRPGGAIYHQMDDGDLDRILSFPPSLIGSDGLPNDRRPHPRLWGAFAKVLGHYVREAGLLPLETAISKMTGQTAAVLGLADRGRIAAGCRADLVLFDPAGIAEGASYEDPIRPAIGLAGVFVNGEEVWDGTAATGARPGHVLKA